MANVWVKTLDGQVIRSERITLLTAVKVPRQGWTVIAELGRGRPADLAALGYGGRAKAGALRLCNELPQAISAAGKGVTVTFVRAGYPRGEGQWSTLAAPPAAVRQIPVVPPGQARRRDSA
jgi:hypothetical protein